MLRRSAATAGITGPGKMQQKMVREARKLSAADIADLAAYYEMLK